MHLPCAIISTPEILIEISRSRPTHIPSRDPNITPELVLSNYHMPCGSLLPSFDADVTCHNPRLAKSEIVNNDCGV